jgi:hypothetical protein
MSSSNIYRNILICSYFIPSRLPTTHVKLEWDDPTLSYEPNIPQSSSLNSKLINQLVQSNRLTSPSCWQNAKDNIFTVLLGLPCKQKPSQRVLKLDERVFELDELMVLCMQWTCLVGHRTCTVPWFYVENLGRHIGVRYMCTGQVALCCSMGVHSVDALTGRVQWCTTTFYQRALQMVPRWLALTKGVRWAPDLPIWCGRTS